MFPNCIADYEQVFEHVAGCSKLHKEDLNKFLNKCDLHPTDKELSKAFDSVFRGKVYYTHLKTSKMWYHKFINNSPNVFQFSVNVYWK